MATHSTPPDGPSPNERELERVYAGDDEAAARAALIELRRLHDGTLRAQAHRQCGGSAEMRDEALQRLDLRLWEKRKNYAPEKGRWIAWAKTLLRNIIIDLFRDGDQASGPPPPGPVDPNAVPSHAMDFFESREPPPDKGAKLQELQA